MLREYLARERAVAARSARRRSPSTSRHFPADLGQRHLPGRPQHAPAHDRRHGEPARHRRRAGHDGAPARGGAGRRAPGALVRALHRARLLCRRRPRSWPSRACSRRHGAAYSSHIRDEANRVFEAVREAIAVAEATGVHVQIAHLKLSGVDNWGGARGCSRRSPRPGAAACRWTATRTRTTPPPIRCATSCRAGSSTAASRRCSSGCAGQRCARAFARRSSETASTTSAAFPPGTSCAWPSSPHLPQEAGRTLGEIARRRGVDPLDAVCDFLLADRGATRILITVDERGGRARDHRARRGC